MCHDTTGQKNGSRRGEIVYLLLKHMDSWDRMPEGLKGQVFERLAHLAAVANLSEADEIAYEKVLDQYYIDQTVRHDEYVKGHEKGIKKGIEQGKQDTARNLKRKGIPLEIIAECTGLSLEDIERL